MRHVSTCTRCACMCLCMYTARTHVHSPQARTARTRTARRHVHSPQAAHVRTLRSWVKARERGHGAGSVGSSWKGTCKRASGVCVRGEVCVCACEVCVRGEGGVRTALELPTQEPPRGRPGRPRAAQAADTPRATRLHQIEGGHRARGRGATSARRRARVSVGEVGEQHAPRAHLVAHLVRATIRG